MNALDYLSRSIRFRESSVITGPWDSAKYRFLESPARDLSNPRIRRMVVYKAASCMGTVFLQCALAYRIERELGHCQVVTQTDEHASKFTIKRGKPFVLAIPGVKSLIPRSDNGKEKLYAITNDHWAFVHKWVKVCGPGESNRNSEQVRWLFTDESHLPDSFPEGALTEFEKRMGNAWNRASLHVTTAADKGREVDKMFHEGQQNEFHLRCLNCKELFWPLWEDDAKGVYGKTLFRWNETLSGGAGRDVNRGGMEQQRDTSTDAAARAIVTPSPAQNSLPNNTQVDHCESKSSVATHADCSEVDAVPTKVGEGFGPSTATLSESEILDTLRLHCPHCDHAHSDTMQTRFELQTHGGYIAQNPDALPEYQSYRWNCFAYYPMPWRESLAAYLSALRAEKMGDLKPMEDFVKKRLCMSYVPRLHGAGQTISGRDYKVGDVWITDERLLRVGSFDVQDEGGFHLWAQCDDYRADGSSRRVEFAKIETWQAARQFQLDHNIDSEHVGIDTQHRHSETLGRCAEWLWYGMRSSDERVFHHSVNGSPVPNRFYGECEYNDSLQGKAIPAELERIRKRTQAPVVKMAGGQIVHTGFCFVRVWSKQNVGMLLMRLKDGSSGRYFGVASDLDERFLEQLHSYIEAMETRKRDGAESIVLKQIKHHDHAFAVTSQGLVIAMCSGFFPLAVIRQP